MGAHQLRLAPRGRIGDQHMVGPLVDAEGVETRVGKRRAPGDVMARHGVAERELPLCGLRPKMLERGIVAEEDAHGRTLPRRCAGSDPRNRHPPPQMRAVLHPKYTR